MYTQIKNSNSLRKAFGLAAPLAIYYFVYQKYANTRTYIDYLDIYANQAATALNDWFSEAVEFQRGALGVQEAALVSLIDYNYVFMNTDKDPLFVLVLLLTLIFAWPSSWVSKIVGSLVSAALLFVTVVATLIGSFFWATYDPLGYTEVNEWITGVTLFSVGLLVGLCYIALTGKRSGE